jgi:hypothetical protein
MITIGVTTFNRLNYIEKSSKSLIDSIKNIDCNVRVYDDSSFEFGKDTLSKHYNFAKEIVIRPKNLGSDENIKLMYENFLDTNDQIFLNADSDLIFNKNWIKTLENVFEFSDGVVSLYNSNQHPSLKEFTINGTCVLEKEHLGSAGVAFSRKIIEKIVKEMKSKTLKGFDWQWSKYLISQNVRLISVKNSQIQHIGGDGQNCNGMDLVDIGLNYFPDSQLNLELLVAYYEELITKLSTSNTDAINSVKKTKNYRVGEAVLSLPRVIKKAITPIK